MVSHPKSEWSMGIGIGKLIQQGTRENHQNLNEEQKVLAVAEKNCVVVNMDNSRIACLEIAKTMKLNQLLCERGIPSKDEGFEKEIPLNPVLLTILYFISLCT